ncbi:MAG: hypothetical protein R3E76_06905 [Planctomycetota bacterium]
MGNRHLEELRGRLATGDWQVVEETVGEGGRPAVWRIQRRKDAGPFHLEFETINNEEPAPIEQAYGVRIRELKQTSIYLYRKRNDEAWTRVLDELISALDELEA